MTFPEPYPGLVIRYCYLWMREHEEGREEGAKDRPCAIVMAVTDEDGEWNVLVLPITHSPPPNPADAIEIPTETNEFLWPGPDLRPVPGGDASTVAYGPLPPRFFAQVRNKFLERDRREKSTLIKRTE